MRAIGASDQLSNARRGPQRGKPRKSTSPASSGRCHLSCCSIGVDAASTNLRRSWSLNSRRAARRAARGAVARERCDCGAEWGPCSVRKPLHRQWSTLRHSAVQRFLASDLSKLVLVGRGQERPLFRGGPACIVRHDVARRGQELKAWIGKVEFGELPPHADHRHPRPARGPILPPISAPAQTHRRSRRRCRRQGHSSCCPSDLIVGAPGADEPALLAGIPSADVRQALSAPMSPIAIIVDFAGHGLAAARSRQREPCSARPLLNCG